MNWSSCFANRAVAQETCQWNIHKSTSNNVSANSTREMATEICEEDFDPRTLERHSAQLACQRGIRVPKAPMRRAREPKQLRRIYCRNRQRSRPRRRQRRQPSQACGLSDDPDPEAGPSAPDTLSVLHSCVSQFERAQLLEISWTRGVGAARRKYGKANVLKRVDCQGRVNGGHFKHIVRHSGGWGTASAYHLWMSVRKLFESGHKRTRETRAVSQHDDCTGWSTSNPVQPSGIREVEKSFCFELMGREGGSRDR